MTPDTCPEGSGAQTTHSFHKGHPADGNCWSLEQGQRARDERLPRPLMSRSPLSHPGPPPHELYLQPLMALDWFTGAAALALRSSGRCCLGGTRPADEGSFDSHRDSSSLVTSNPRCWPMAQALSPPRAETRVVQQSPEVTLISTLSLGWEVARLTPPTPLEHDFIDTLEENARQGLGECV